MKSPRFFRTWHPKCTIKFRVIHIFLNATINFTETTFPIVIISFISNTKKIRLLTWKWRIIVHMRPSVNFGLPSTMSSALMFTNFIWNWENNSINPRNTQLNPVESNTTIDGITLIQVWVYLPGAFIQYPMSRIGMVSNFKYETILKFKGLFSRIN